MKPSDQRNFVAKFFSANRCTIFKPERTRRGGLTHAIADDPTPSARSCLD
jgi:hypothetical protein